MEIVIIAVVILVVATYYGFTKSFETVANIGNREVDYLDAQHKVSIVERTAKMADKINDDNVTKAAEVRKKIDTLFD